MDEFLHWEPDAMSSDETTRIEPTLIAKDTSIATEVPAAIEPKAESETAKPEIIATDAKAEMKAEAPVIDAVDELNLRRGTHDRVPNIPRTHRPRTHHK